MMNRQQIHERIFCRRDFLHVGAIPLMGLSLPALLASESATTAPLDKKPAKNIILVWLNGGPSTIDMWDLKPHAKSSIRGEFKPVSTAATGIEICEDLPRMAKQMDHCTLIRSVTHTIAEHTQGAEYVLTGNPISAALKYPSIGSIVASQVASESGRKVPCYIDLSGFNKGDAGYLGASYNPFVVDRFQDQNARKPKDQSTDQFTLPDDITLNDLTRKSDLLARLERGFRRFDKSARADEMLAFQTQAIDILTAGKTRDALDVFAEKQTVIERYGSTSFGLSALAAKRLVKAGVRFVTIGMNGWDTHSQNFAQLRNGLLARLDRGLATLIEDLDAEGLLSETIVYCVGEFSRTPSINPQAGRDHWSRAMSVLVAGGGFRSGFAYGSTDDAGAEPDSSRCSPADINATILNQIDIRPVTRLITSSGRPMPLFREASILTELCSNL
jgi:hypothetical protein